jgi:hypothetical protein
MKTQSFKIIIAISLISIMIGFNVVPIATANQKNFNAANTPYTPAITQDPVHDLLIITPAGFAAILEALVDHKNDIGVNTILVTLDTIYSESPGRDEAEQIKYYIKYAVEEWGIQYVLLVGGMRHQGPGWHTPIRYVAMDDGWEEHYLTDLYFADIYDNEGNFSSWDYDNDGIFGEWPYQEIAEDKNIDLIPDIAVGRIPARNAIEVLIMVQKIIQYERNAYGQPWFNEIVLIAGDTYPEFLNPNWTGYEGEEYADEALSYLNGFNPTKLYTSNGQLTGPDVVIETISEGCGLLYFVGHGNPMTWGNHPPNNKTFVTGLSVEHMPQLKNQDRTPICVVSGCHNSQFDVSIFRIFDSLARYRGEFTPESWSWWLTRKLGGGSVATLGCSALGYTKEDKDSFDGGLNWIEVEFFRQYGQENLSIIGDAWRSAVTNYVTTYAPINWDETTDGDSFIDVKVPQSFVLFGDPSLCIGGIPS